MKKTVTILCMALLSMASLPSFAQFKFGVTVGVSSNSYGYNFEDSDDEDEEREVTKPKIGYKVGLAAEYSFVEAVSLQTGLTLANKGAKYELEESGESLKATSSINYLEIPLNLAFKISNFQIHAGPYFGYGLSGKSEIELTSGGDTESEDYDVKFKNNISEDDDLDEDASYLRRTDIGLNLGAGYRVGSVLVTATYSKGFSNIYPTFEGEDDDDKTTNKGFSLAATWFF